MIGFTKARDERIKALEAQAKALNAEVNKLRLEVTVMDDEARKRVVDGQLKKQAIDSDLKAIRQVEHTKRFQAKAEVSKEVIREMRRHIKVAVVSIRNLAQRRPNEVTAAHLSELAWQAENLVQFTDLPR